MNKPVALIVAGLLACLLFAGQSMGAVTLNVPSAEYPTIQAAINAAASGDIIQVAPGHYLESLGGWRDIEIFKSISLKGAGSTQTIVELSGLQHGVEIHPDLDGNVLIQGIAFTKRDGNPTSADWAIIVGETGGTFHGLIFRDVEVAYAGARNLYFANATYDYALIDGCNIHHSAAWGFSARGVLTDLNIVDSFFDYNGTVDAAHGIGFDIDMPVTVSKVSVSGGSFSHNTAKGINLVQTHNTTFTGITASSNSGAPGGGFGISLWEWLSTSSGLTFENCTIENNSTDGILFGTEGTCTITGISVQKCRITGNGRSGIMFFMDYGGSASNIAVNGCYLDGNGSGGGIARSHLAASIDGSANWWGVATPDGVALKAGTNIDYTPWLERGTDLSSAPGFQADWSVLWVDDGGLQTGTTGRIQEAIGLVSGSTINVAAGLYDERVIVNRAVTLKGATNGVSKKGFAVPLLYAYDPLTQSIIKPSTPLEQEVVTIAADNVVFDGFVVANQVCATGGVYQDLVGIGQSLAAPTGIQILNNVLGPNTNTASQDGSMGRCGVTVYGPHSTGPVKLIVRGNKIFDSKGNGAGIMIIGPYGPTYHHASYTSLFSGSVIEDNEITGNHRSGIELAGGVQGGAAPADYFMIRNNLVTNNGWFSLDDKDKLKYGNGIMFIRGGDDRINCDASGSRYMSITDNEITGNEKCGLYIGPMNKDLFFNNNVVKNNGLGTGGYSLWDGIRVDLAESYYALASTCVNYGYLTNIPFLNGVISGNGDYGYRVIQTPTLGSVDARQNWWGTASGPYHPTLNPGGTGNDVSDNVLFSPWSGTFGIAVAPVTTLTNCTTPQTVTFHIDQAGTPSDQVRGYEVQFQIDPAVVTVANPSTLPPSDVLEGTFLKSVGLTQFFVLNNGSGLYTVNCAILGGSHGGIAPGDLFSVLLTPVAQGTSAVTITSIKVRDLNNAPLAASGTGGSIHVDCTPPAPPTNFVALPGHNKVHLTWTNPSGDPDFVGVEIRRVAWGDYPEYGTPGPGAPSYPANHTQGMFVALVPGTTYTDASMGTARDIYYYAAFSKDLAGNYSMLGSTAWDRSTSYWLGDVIPNPGFDGIVDLSDLGAFGQTFGLLEGAVNFNDDCDFGPTDDWSRLGIPLPDNKIDFEDLMIFSMNYHMVTPEGLYEYAAAGRAIENLEDLVTFKLVSNEDGSISIVLANKASTLKGIHFVATVEGGTLERIERGSLFSGAPELFFGLVPGARNTADISAAALGVDVPFVRSGVVVRLVVNRTGDDPVSVKIKAVDLRNVDNKKTEIASSDEHETPFVPKTTALMQNFPNPFNPTTTLTFDVAQAGNVAIQIYDVSGRLVATVLNARTAIGRHQVEWNGKDANGSLVPSGIYFYRLKTAGYEATKKMILVR